MRGSRRIEAQVLDPWASPYLISALLCVAENRWQVTQCPHASGLRWHGRLFDVMESPSAVATCPSG